MASSSTHPGRRAAGALTALLLLPGAPALAQSTLLGLTSQRLPMRIEVGADGGLALFQVEYDCAGAGGSTRSAFRPEPACFPEPGGAFVCGGLEACGDRPSFLFEGALAGELAAGAARVRTTRSRFTGECCETAFRWSVISEAEGVFRDGFETLP